MDRIGWDSRGGAALMHRLMAEEKVSVSPFESVDEARDSHSYNNDRFNLSYAG